MDIKEIISKMTTEEKAAFVNGYTSFHTAGFEKLGIPSMLLLDGGTGMNFEQLFGEFYDKIAKAEKAGGMTGSASLSNVRRNFYKPQNLSDNDRILHGKIKESLDKATERPDMSPGCYPPGVALGATFSPETVYEVGEALGAEACAYKVDILLGTPNVNILRDPLNGRFFEGYSEDPCVVSTLAPELVKGVQTYPVGANVKHFAANNQETNRVGINEVISVRALEEIYFPGFMACVEKGNVDTVMSAYNKINGIACSENTWLLTDTLREEWGFDGFVMSDWGAVYNPVAAIKAGNDLAMPGPIDGRPLVEAVKNGTLSEEALDKSVYNILSFIKNLRERREAFNEKIPTSKIIEKGNKAAYRAAAEGIVMLKNDGIFPLSADRIFIVGSGREEILTCGTGSAGVVTDRNTYLTDELRKIYGDRVIVSENIDTQSITSRDVVLCVAALTGMEGNDRPDMNMTDYDRNVTEIMIKKKAEIGFKAGLILNVCAPVDISEYEAKIDGIFCIFLPGMQGGKALADMLCGRLSPSGKLPFTWCKSYRDTPTFLNFPGDGWEVNYGEGIYVGYRYYDKKQTEPQYPFGHGLSYTSFEIFDVKADKTEFSDTVNIGGRIKNIGNMTGSQVVMLFVSDVVSTHSKPVKELKAFKKLCLEVGEEREFSFTLTKKDFEYYDADYNRFLAEEGYFDILIGTSAKEISAKMRVYLSCESPYSYGINSTMKVMYENRELKAALLDWWKDEGLDRGILDSGYQYVSCKKLSHFIPQHISTDEKENEKFASFMRAVRSVRKN